MVIKICVLWVFVLGGITPVMSRNTLPLVVNEEEVVLRRGTLVVLTLFTDVSTEENSKNDPVSLSSYQNVLVSGKVVINEGRTGNGLVKIARKGGAVGRAGKIQVTAVSIQAVDGQDVYLTGETPIKEGKSRRPLAILMSIVLSGAVLTMLAIFLNGSSLLPAFAAAVLVFFISAFFIFRGGHAQINAGTQIHCRVTSDVRVKA